MTTTKSVMYLTMMVAAALFLTGCLDYKAYGAEEQNEANLIDEIAAIERDLNPEPAADLAEEAQNLSEEVEEEVVLPEWGEEAADLVVEEELEVINVKENELVRLKVQVSDPDKDTVTYTYSKPLNKEGEWQTQYGDAGEYIVTITASDGTLTTEKRVKLAVARVNVPPLIETLRDLAVREGETVTFEPKVTDPNKDEVTATVSEPLASGSWKTDHTSAGEYQIKVAATDGELEAEQFFTLVVEDVNVLPEVSNLPETITVEEGETVTLSPVVSDLDEDKITVTIGNPVGDDGVWETGYTDHGAYVVAVSISDGKDKIIKKVQVEVTDVNQPPLIEEVYVESS